MPTVGRLVYDESIHHIIQRGNNRQKIFKDDGDFEKFLSLIRDYKAKFTFELYHYCLMSNHLHLLIKIHRKSDLAKVMQGISQSFRFYYRKRYRYTGYLYQGRYKSKLIEKDEYLLECARYIERNPIRAGIVKDLGDYKWSSYGYYAYAQINDIITENPLYETLGNDIITRQCTYSEYVRISRSYEEIIDKEFGIY